MKDISINDKIKISWTPTQLTRNATAQLRLKLTLPYGIHIQAHTPKEKLLIPTVVNIAGTKDVFFGKPVYPKPDILPTSWSKVELLVYEGDIEIILPVTVSRNAKLGRMEIEADLSYQGCTASLCLPPKKQKFTLIFNIK